MGPTLTNFANVRCFERPSSSGAHPMEGLFIINPVLGAFLLINPPPPPDLDRDRRCIFIE